MSKRIIHIIDVIKKMRDDYHSRSAQSSIRDIRRNATKSIAARWEITIQTVEDKYNRQLRPDIKTTEEFDHIMEDWLVNNSGTLKAILHKHSVDSGDTVLIDETFSNTSEEDGLLGDEFDYNPISDEFKEGKKRLKLHLSRERNRSLVNDAKAKWLQEGCGDIKCHICEFSFLQTYEERGRGFIEAHHIIPISSLESDTPMKVSDLAPVCSNCHRIIHRSKPWLSVNEIKKIILKEQ